MSEGDHPLNREGADTPSRAEAASMVMRTTAESLLASPLETTLIEAIAENVRASTGRRPSPSEVKSWQRSLPVLAHDLLDAGLGKVEMLIEYKLPLTSRRADVVLAGVRSGAPARTRTSSSSSSSGAVPSRPTATRSASSSTACRVAECRIPPRRFAGTASTCSTSSACSAAKPDARVRRRVPPQRDGPGHSRTSRSRA